MVLFKTSLYLLLGAIMNVLACPIAPNNSAISRRWHSVSDLKDQCSAWPVTTPGIQPVRYCWARRSDKFNLQAILDKAIDKWDIAMQGSALQIIPDQAAGANICGLKGVRNDALKIQHVTSSNTHSAGMTTQGYSASDGANQHTLKFHVEYPQKAAADPDPHDVLMMAHELGHAIGLEHEHSRPDASSHTWFYCENLADYDEVKAKIQSPDTIHSACTSRETALKYDFSAWAYLPPTNPASNSKSKAFDMDSIMMYGSYDGGRSHAPTDKSSGMPVLLGHSPGEKHPDKGRRFKVYMGGSEDKAQAGVSMGDVARVAQLYPSKNPQDAENAGANEDEWKEI